MARTDHINPTTDLKVINFEHSLWARWADACNSWVFLRLNMEFRNGKKENPSENTAKYKYSGARPTNQNSFPGLARKEIFALAHNFKHLSCFGALVGMLKMWWLVLSALLVVLGSPTSPCIYILTERTKYTPKYVRAVTFHENVNFKHELLFMKEPEHQQSS